MKILIIDDDKIYRELMGKALAKNGYIVTLANDGAQAVEKAQNDNFDMIITDIFMPNKEGIEVIHEIRQLHPAIKIIAISSDGVTGHSSFLKIAEAYGANLCLQKPFSSAHFVEKVNAVASGQEKKLGAE